MQREKMVSPVDWIKELRSIAKYTQYHNSQQFLPNMYSSPPSSSPISRKQGIEYFLCFTPLLILHQLENHPFFVPWAPWSYAELSEESLKCRPVPFERTGGWLHGKILFFIRLERVCLKTKEMPGRVSTLSLIYMSNRYTRGCASPIPQKKLSFY